MIALALGILTCTASAASDDPPCPGGWLAVQAQVVYVNPNGASAGRSLADGTSDRVRVNDVLCDGDTLVVDAAVREIRLKEGSTTNVYKPPQRKTYRAPSHPWLNRARSLVDATIQGLAILQIRLGRPVPTAPNREDGSVPFQVARFLVPDTPQVLTVDVSPAIGWIGGATPYLCSGTKVAEGQLWCTVATPVASTAHAVLLVESADGNSARWSLSRAEWTDVPRPDWIPPGAGPTDESSQAAWALWLWREGPPQWRLQALGMFESVSRDNWLAETLLDMALIGVLKPQPPAQR